MAILTPWTWFNFGWKVQLLVFGLCGLALYWGYHALFTDNLATVRAAPPAPVVQKQPGEATQPSATLKPPSEPTSLPVVPKEAPRQPVTIYPGLIAEGVPAGASFDYSSPAWRSLALTAVWNDKQKPIYGRDYNARQRLRGLLKIQQAGTYTFSATEHARIRVDEFTVIEESGTGTIYLDPGYYDLTLDLTQGKYPRSSPVVQFGPPGAPLRPLGSEWVWHEQGVLDTEKAPKQFQERPPAKKGPG